MDCMNDIFTLKNIKASMSISNMMKVAVKDIIFAEILRYSDHHLADIMYRQILDI